MLQIKDQLNRIICLNEIPKRIVSIVPSQTELLYDLGLDEEVVGITKFCIHPKNWFKHKVRVGGTKKVDIEKVTALKPDLIIANKEENTKIDVESLQNIAPTYISDIYNLDDALKMIEDIGILTNKESKAKSIVNLISSEFKSLLSASIHHQKTCCYLIWYNPYMTIGENTFINSLLMCCGFKNVFDCKLRYPSIDLEEIFLAKPDVIMLSSEPYPFKQRHIDELKVHLPNSKIILVDGEMFSWYGSRLQKAPAYFLSLLKEIDKLNN